MTNLKMSKKKIKNEIMNVTRMFSPPSLNSSGRDSYYHYANPKFEENADEKSNKKEKIANKKKKANRYQTFLFLYHMDQKDNFKDSVLKISNENIYYYINTFSFNV